MPRRNFNDGQEQIYQDFNKMSSAIERTFFDRVIYELIQRQENSFFGDSFLTEFATSTSVTIRPGSGFQTDATQVDPEPTKRHLYNSASQTVNISTPDNVNDRYDIVVVKHALIDALTESRKYKDAGTGVISSQNLVVQKDWEATIEIVAGTPAASPTVPSTPAGYIKIAELYINAVAGMSGAGDVVDTRVALPIGEEILVDTLAMARIVQGAAVSLADVFDSIDGYLEVPLPKWEDYVAQGTDPAAPAAGRKRVYFKGDTMYFRNEGGTITPIGSGGGGGGGANWQASPGNEPQESSENGEKVWLFETGAGQKLVLFVKVPQSYLQGRQIKLYLGMYSPSAANTILLETDCYLIRKNVDAVSSVANKHDSGNTALTNTVANQYREAELELTDATGQVNGFAVQAGALLRIELIRGTDTDTDDIRFIPSATEVKFS